MTISKKEILALPANEQWEIARLIVENQSSTEADQDIYDQRFDDMVTGEAETYTYDEAMQIIADAKK